jgi:hypothetical protein
VPPSSTIADLRRLLADRFPTSSTRDGRVVATGSAAVDEALGGGLGSGTFTEIVSSGPSCGGQLLTASLIEATRKAGQRVALLDAANAFAVDSLGHDDALTAHLVWFRGTSLRVFWQAADIVLRDANFAAVIMDLRLLPEREIKRTPATTWYRLQRAIEQSEAAVLVHTDFAVVPCANRRLILAEPLTMAAFKTDRSELQAALRPQVQLQRNQRRIAG